MVWLEELVTEIVTSIRNGREGQPGITVNGPRGEKIKVNCVYKAPESEGGFDIHEQIPIVTVHLYDLIPDIPRKGSLHHGIKQKEIDMATNQAILKDYPEPYLAFVQFTILAEYSQHLLAIIRQLQQMFRPRDTIYIPDSADSELVPLYMEMVDFRDVSRIYGFKTTTDEGRERQFSSLMRYSITIELPVERAETYDIVRERDFSFIVLDL